MFYPEYDSEGSYEIKILAIGNFGRRVLNELNIPEKDYLEVIYLNDLNNFDSDFNSDILFVLTDKFDRDDLCRFDLYSMIFILGCNMKIELDCEMCFVYSQNIEQYQSLINVIVDLFTASYDDLVIPIEYCDLKDNFIKKGNDIIIFPKKSLRLDLIKNEMAVLVEKLKARLPKNKTINSILCYVSIKDFDYLSEALDIFNSLDMWFTDITILKGVVIAPNQEDIFTITYAISL